MRAGVVELVTLGIEVVEGKEAETEVIEGEDVIEKGTDVIETEVDAIVTDPGPDHQLSKEKQMSMDGIGRISCMAWG